MWTGRLHWKPPGLSVAPPGLVESFSISSRRPLLRIANFSDISLLYGDEGLPFLVRPCGSRTQGHGPLQQSAHGRAMRSAVSRQRAAGRLTRSSGVRSVTMLSQYPTPIALPMYMHCTANMRPLLLINSACTGARLAAGTPRGKFEAETQIVNNEVRCGVALCGTGSEDLAVLVVVGIVSIELPF